MDQEELIEEKSLQKASAAMRTIGEVSELVDVPQHVLRFWESKFRQINPRKSRGRRYYRVEDVDTILKVKHLLYEEGYTIKGVKQNLSKGKSPQEKVELPLEPNEQQDTVIFSELNRILKLLIKSRDDILYQSN